MNKISKTNVDLLVVPRHGLGDILYNSLCVRFLKDKGLIKNELVFVPFYGQFITDLFSLESCPFYSCLLNSRLEKRINIKNELHFWLKLLNNRKGNGFSIINDSVDNFLFRIAGIKKFPTWNIGNYLKIHPSGLRGKLNKILSTEINHDHNPKHILQRSLILINQVTKCSLNDLWVIDTKYYNDENDIIDPLIFDYVLLPDAAEAQRQININDLNKIISTLHDLKKVVIFSNNNYIHQSIRSVKVARYPKIQHLCRILNKCKMVICADSFGAHIAGLMKPKNIIVLYSNKIKYPNYWEWWGIPSKNAYHFWMNQVFVLDADYLSMNASISHLPEEVKKIHDAIK